jgi:hypothetical protein
MKWLIGITALVGGMLLAVVPRFILPACGYMGFPAMRCTQTARAAMVAGALLVGSGLGALVTRQGKASLGTGGLAAVLFFVSLLLPDVMGYCRGTQMPCNYGMVPAIRFVAALGGLVVLAGVAGLGKSARRGSAAP